jgi:hypothetical protein
MVVSTVPVQPVEEAQLTRAALPKMSPLLNDAPAYKAAGPVVPFISTSVLALMLARNKLPVWLVADEHAPISILAAEARQKQVSAFHPNPAADGN